MTESTAKFLISKAASGNGVMYVSDPEKPSLFEKLYLKIREKEGRIYPDSIVENLPHIHRSHPLYREWKTRCKSMNKLEAYLIRKSKAMTILDLGCGNGWMSNRLAKIPGCDVYAVDLNRKELEQGARVFSERASLQFVFGDIFEDILPELHFDIIILGSVIQYFQDLRVLVSRLTDLLAAKGEVHIFDSPIYSEETVHAARQRSIEHYQKLGYPEMTDYYYHHQWSDLGGCNYQVRYDPQDYLHRFQRKFLKETISPFPWIIIQP